MTPLLFPHTYMPPELIAAAARWFEQLTIYQPVAGRLPKGMQPWVDNGFLKVRVPVPEGSDRVAAAVGDYQNWARRQHSRHGLRTVLPRSGPNPPFFDDSATSKILSDLKGTRSENADDAPERLFRARLFLCLAQDLDQERRELADRLVQVETHSQSLMDQLKAADKARRSKAGERTEFLADDASEYMPAGRIRAWAQIFLADSLEPPMLLTTSRSIIEDLLGSHGTARLLRRLSAGSPSLPAAGDANMSPKALLSAELGAVAGQPLPSEEGPPAVIDPPSDAADLTLYLIPDQPQRRVLHNVAAGRPEVAIAPRPPAGADRQTVVGWLNPRSASF